MTTFSAGVDKLSDALKGFPTDVSHTHRVTAEVVVNDGGALRELREDERACVMGYVNKTIADQFQARVPDACRFCGVTRPDWSDWVARRHRPKRPRERCSGAWPSLQNYARHFTSARRPSNRPPIRPV